MNQNDARVELLASPAEEGGVTLLDLLLAMKESRRLMLVTPLVCGLLALAVAFVITPSFTATTQIMTPQQQQNAAASLLGSLSGLGGALSLGGMKNPSEQWVGLLKSRTVADALVEKFDLMKVYDTEYMFAARDRLASDTRITAGKDGLISIEVDAHDPKLAAAIANGYVERLQAMSNTLAVSEAAQRRLFFEQQLVDAKGALTKAQIALGEAGVGAGVLKTSPEASVGEIATLKARVAAAEVRLAVMRGSLTPASPEYQLAERELNSLRAQMEKAAQQELGAGTGSGSEYVTRFRDFKYAETMFEMLAKQYELAKVDEAKDGALVQVVDPALVPEWKSKPKRALIALGGFAVGFLLAAAYVFTRLLFRTNNDPEIRSKLLRLVGRPG